MSINGSILIVFIVIVRSLIYHKVSKSTFQILWGIAITSLTIPFSIPFFNEFSSNRDATNQSNSIYQIYRETNIFLNSSISPTDQIMSLKNSFAIFYGCIVILLFFYLVYSYSKSIKPINEAILSDSILINQWCRKQNTSLKRTVKVYISDQVQSPVTAGVIHPKIILPSDLDFDNLQNLECILTHEMTHIKNYDVAKKYLLLFVTMIHFFNPFVWVMYTLFNRDIETYCDEKTISELGENKRKSYALCLLNYIESKQRSAMFQQAFAKNAIEERIESIMKRPLKGSKLISIMLVTVVIGIFIIVASFNSQSNAQTTVNEPKNVTTKQVEIKPRENSDEMAENDMTAARLAEEMAENDMRAARLAEEMAVFELQKDIEEGKDH